MVRMTEPSWVSAQASTTKRRGAKLATRACRGTILGVACLGAAAPIASASSGGVAKIQLTHFASLSYGPQVGSAVAVDPGSNTIAVTGTAGKASSTTVSKGLVWLVDGRRRRVAHMIALPGAAESGVADDSATGTFYVGDPDITVPPDTSAGGVAVIDARSGKLTDEIPLAGASGGIGVDPRTDVILASGPGYGVTPINGHGNTALPALGAGNIFYPGPVAIDPAADVAFIAGGASGGTDGVWFVNLANGDLFGVPKSRPVNILMTNAPVGLVTDPATDRTYAAIDTQSGGALATIDGTNQRFASTKTIKNSNSAAGIAVDAKTNVVFMGNVNETAGCPDFVDEVSGRTGKVLAAVHNLPDVTSLAVDPNRDTAYVLDGARLDVFRGGYADKQKKCGTPGTVIGAVSRPLSAFGGS
jgi:hypothetical protein